MANKPGSAVEPSFGVQNCLSSVVFFSEKVDASECYPCLVDGWQS